MVELIFLLVGVILAIVIMMWRDVHQLRVDLGNLESAIDDLGAEIMLCMDKNSAEIEIKLDSQIDNVRAILDNIRGS